MTRFWAAQETISWSAARARTRSTAVPVSTFCFNEPREPFSVATFPRQTPDFRVVEGSLRMSVDFPSTDGLIAIELDCSFPRAISYVLVGGPPSVRIGLCDI